MTNYNVSNPPRYFKGRKVKPAAKDMDKAKGASATERLRNMKRGVNGTAWNPAASNTNVRIEAKEAD